jgi:hypothetical protein
MEKLENQVTIALSKLESQGKVVYLSAHDTSFIEESIASSIKEIRNEFELKEKKSKAIISKFELTSMNKF